MSYVLKIGMNLFHKTLYAKLYHSLHIPNCGGLWCIILKLISKKGASQGTLHKVIMRWQLVLLVLLASKLTRVVAN